MSLNRSSALKLSEAAPLFAALGDETRLKLVSRLSSEGPLSIVRLSEGSEVTRQAITKHLRALADAGLVHDTRRGRECIWELRPKRLEKAREHLDHISRQWDAALGRLQDFLRENP
ncbi:MAG TPA: metalloregulator ArsR/SmtB family transcription factor [Polyangiaceae bacterium]|nr:metalloregulator ArsR/SmtB family transcription factor [Polyangiaceae bacterium]